MLKKMAKKFRGQHYMILVQNQKKDLFRQLSVPPAQRSGSWKKKISAEDYILELDNTSVTHRADLWGVRGVAREFAAILGLDLKPLEPELKKNNPKKGR